MKDEITTNKQTYDQSKITISWYRQQIRKKSNQIFSTIYQWKKIANTNVDDKDDNDDDNGDDNDDDEDGAIPFEDFGKSGSDNSVTDN